MGMRGAHSLAISGGKSLWANCPALAPPGGLLQSTVRHQAPAPTDAALHPPPIPNFPLAGRTDAAAVSLRLGCQNNLGSCHLALGRWSEARADCDAVLAADPANRKALYRRGQALLALQLPELAVRDLAAALGLAEGDDRDVIAAKLAEARKLAEDKAPAAQAPRGGVEVEDAPPTELRGVEAGQPRRVGDVVIEEVTAEDVPGVDEPTAEARGPAAAITAAAQAPLSTGLASAPPAVGPDAAAPAAVAARLGQDPDAVQHALRAVGELSDEELAAQLAAGGAPPGMTPAMARAAAGMVQGMSPDQLRWGLTGGHWALMGQSVGGIATAPRGVRPCAAVWRAPEDGTQSSAGVPRPRPNASLPCNPPPRRGLAEQAAAMPAPARPSGPGSAAAAPAARSDGAAGAAGLPGPPQDPRAMASMLRSMDPSLLQSMAGSGGLPPGTQVHIQVAVSDSSVRSFPCASLLPSPRGSPGSMAQSPCPPPHLPSSTFQPLFPHAPLATLPAGRLHDRRSGGDDGEHERGGHGKHDELDGGRRMSRRRGRPSHARRRGEWWGGRASL